MQKVGLTGPIGSGKSYVAARLRGMGYSVYDSDKEARSLIERSAAIREAIAGLLGNEAYDAEGRYRRKWVAARVFEAPELLGQLNAIVHPAVFADFSAWASSRQLAGETIVFFESALLASVAREYLEALDCVVLVQADKECRLRRVAARDATSRAAILLRMQNQASDAEFEAIADYRVQNDGQMPIDDQLVELLKGLQQR